MDSSSPAPRDSRGQPRAARDDRQRPSWPGNNMARYRTPDAVCLAVGDLHLWSLLTVHHALNRVGVVATLRMLTVRKVHRAVSACRYFELTGLGDLLSLMPEAAGSAQFADAFDAEYRQRFADGAELIRAAQWKVATAPEDFTVTGV
ncbi:hypothetical protein [Rugosimonospora africana]|uniref:Uncharacterized protein n=1 Tax=Rugosimonospora africana TaxID=556532 RepID=A0A8J3VQ82_9ACTN|nr:hypothetical protein [Rugosimonospora africana]GIH14186.1 hypothetical protein Raf01_23580 [Rugosimonospora africana]